MTTQAHQSENPGKLIRRKTTTQARVAALAAALGGLIGLGILTAPSAAADYSQCPEEKFCMWQHTNYTGMSVYSSNPQPSLLDFNDRARSFWNRTDGWIAVCKHSNYNDGRTTGQDWPLCWEIAPGASSANLGITQSRFDNDVNVMTGMNDEISSFKPGRCEGTPYYVFN